MRPVKHRPNGREERNLPTARRAAATVALAVMFLTLTATPASAVGQPRNWRDGRGVGTEASGFGVHRGWYVRSWQAILWSREDLCCQNDIDGIFGTGTANATKAWQNAHNLTADGKVGYYTWNKAQHGRHYQRQYDTYVSHMWFVKYVDANRQNEKWRFKEPGKSRYISYFWSSNLVCWFLGRTWNSSNDATTVFNHKIVDDNPRCSGE